MLTLTTAASAEAPPVPDASDPRVTVWRDPGGVVCAYGQTIEDEHWVHLPAVGAFSFAAGGSTVTAVPAAGASAALVADAYRRTVLPLALQAVGRQVLHASAVSIGGDIAAFCGVSGTGKSTVAGALSRRGHDLWADDAVCFETDDPTVRAVGLPFSLRLRPASADLLGLDGHADRLDEPPPGGRLAVVFVLERVTGRTGPTLRTLERADAFRPVLTHGYCFDLHDPARRREMVNHYFDLVERVPVHELRFGEGLERLPEMLDLIEGVMPARDPSAP